MAIFKMDPQQLIGVMAACIMGGSRSSEFGGEFDIPSVGRAVAQASDIMGIIDRTWGPTPALATEDRAKQLIHRELQYMLPNAVKAAIDAEVRKEPRAVPPQGGQTEEGVS
jgi:hypothetical protein